MICDHSLAAVCLCSPPPPLSFSCESTHLHTVRDCCLCVTDQSWLTTKSLIIIPVLWTCASAWKSSYPSSSLPRWDQYKDHFRQRTAVELPARSSGARWRFASSECHGHGLHHCPGWQWQQPCFHPQSIRKKPHHTGTGLEKKIHVINSCIILHMWCFFYLGIRKSNLRGFSGHTAS